MNRLSRFLLLDRIDSALAETNLIEKQRFRLFRITTLFAVIVFFIFVAQVYLAMTLDVWAIAAVTILFITVFLNYFVLLVHCRTVLAYGVLVFTLFTLLHVITYYSGGIRNSGMFFLTAIILTTYMLLGQRFGRVMSVISLLHVIYFYLLSTYTDVVNYDLIGHSQELIDFDFLSSGLVCVLVVTAQSAYLERAKHAIAQDILMRTREVHTKNMELQRKNTELEQFAYVASHDMQEPLRTISGFVEILERQYKGKFDNGADKYLEYIRQSSDRMKRLIKDLLDYSRIGRKNEVNEVDCNQVMQDVLVDLDLALNESGAQLRIDPLPVIRGYTTEIKQLFQNLLFNAVKFRLKDIAPDIHISARQDPEKGHWLFSFRDNGIGIDPAHADRIFVIFQRLHTRTEYEGSGIGLSHCKKIVELHHGRIWVESRTGEGSNFKFTLHENGTL